MATIQERAYATFPPFSALGNNKEKIGRRGYVKGARDQRKIDIKNACIAYCACCYCGCEIDARTCIKLIEFRKELRKTMDE